MVSWRAPGSILKPPGSTLKGLRLNFFQDFRVILALCAENLPRTCSKSLFHLVCRELAKNLLQIFFPPSILLPQCPHRCSFSVDFGNAFKMVFEDILVLLMMISLPLCEHNYFFVLQFRGAIIIAFVWPLQKLIDATCPVPCAGANK